MNIAKRLKGLNLLRWPKKQSLFKAVPYAFSALLASWLGTYLDLYFVGKGVYEFPNRPFPSIFSINIVFTLVGLPIFVWLFLFIMKRVSKWKRWVFIIVLSILAPAGEKLSEQWGFFWHSDQWSHHYSLVGYFLFFAMSWFVFKILLALLDQT